MYECTRTYSLVESAEEDGEAKRRKLGGKGEGISMGETWRMTLKSRAKNWTAGENGGLSEACNLNVMKGDA